MKKVLLSREGALKLRKRAKTLQEFDCIDLGRSFLPGEWIILHDEREKKDFLAFVNLHVDGHWPIIHVLDDETSAFSVDHDEQKVGHHYIEQALQKAIKRRSFFKGYEKGCRLVYGEGDALPGLIVELYCEWILVQINTAGIDRFRNEIKEILIKHYPHHKVAFYDWPAYRSAEHLPLYDRELPFDSLKVEENGLFYQLKKTHMQKVGLYYDHRANRERFYHLLRNYNAHFVKGADLFCYCGGWGGHLLKAGVEEVSFVDQANLSEEMEYFMAANQFGGRGHFIRDNVYNYLDSCFERKEFFDVICSDPPAFTKSVKQRQEAISGYRRLHEKVLRVVKEGGVMAICSCSHYVTLEELDQTVQEAAIKLKKKIYLIDTGLQGFDHPIHSLSDRGYYLKYLAYRVE